MNTSIQTKNKLEPHLLFKIARFRKEIRKTNPHKHNSYFEIIYLSKGSGTHAIDHQSYAVKPFTLFTVRKEQVHHWELNEEPDGFVLILKKGFVDNSLDKDLKKLLGQVSAYPCIYLESDEAVEPFFELLLREYRPETMPNLLVVEGLLKALLAKIQENAHSITHSHRNKSDLYESFCELLSTSLKNNVAHYASLLHTSPQNLNAACRKANNQSAAEILAEFIISEAKRLLIYTDMTISEIAITLDFKDNSHFVKYFKRHTTSTPSVFRALHH